MPGEEGTGLHAFDDLDPVSTVSALNMLNEPDEVSGQVGLPPPGTRSSAQGSTPPPPRRAGASGNGAGVARQSAPPPPPPLRAGQSVAPPPPPRAAAGRSAPPPLPAPAPAISATDPEALTDEPEAEFDEDTKVVPNAFTHDPEFARTAGSSRAEGDASEERGDSGEGTERLAPVTADQAAATELQAGAGDTGASPAAANGIGDNELLELSATTVATKIDMDWDEDDAETKLRDEIGHTLDANPAASAALPMIGGRPSPFPAAPPPAGGAPFSGNPSPFAVARSSYTPSANDAVWEDEDEAMTTVMAPGSLSLPSISGSEPAADSFGGGRLVEAAQRFLTTVTKLTSGEHGERPLAGNRLAWIGFAAVALIAFTIAARALVGGRQLATVTLITKPTDALVTVDGRPLTGQTSPFTVQGLKPGIDHTIDVTRDGYVTSTHRFQVFAGEVKPLPTVELAATRVDTGFALTSLPAGASVYVDGRRVDQVTPVRIADLASGLHVLRLEYGTAYQPWETQVALAAGQMIELPTARLMPAAPAQVALLGRGEHVQRNDAPAPQSSSSSSDSSAHHHSPAKHTSTALQPVARPSMPMPAQMRTPTPAPMPIAMAGGGGSQGSLRVNSRPWSQVFVDGRMVGNTPQLNLPLPSGHHKIKLVNPQLGMSKGFAVDIRAGKVATKIVDLE